MRVGRREDGPARPCVTRAADGGVVMPRSDQQTIQLIHLSYREGLSFEETGRALGRSANSARKLWGRAIERLDHELREMFSS
jgi:hypothetical protein